MKSRRSYSSSLAQSSRHLSHLSLIHIFRNWQRRERPSPQITGAVRSSSILIAIFRSLTARSARRWKKSPGKDTSPIGEVESIDANLQANGFELGTGAVPAVDSK